MSQQAEQTSVVSRFQELAGACPEATAVQFGDETLDYGRLDQSANRIACALRKMGVGPETLVALLAPRSPALIAAVLGILKAGGAYLPLDPQYPSERLLFMLEDSKATVLLGERDCVNALGAPAMPTLLLE